MSDRLRDEYFRYGVDYYAAGRFAYYARAIPVVGNLFHHALEMLIKGRLCATGISEKDRRKLGHDLEKLWAALRVVGAAQSYPAGVSRLPSFDVMIGTLNAFEEIRYPEQLLGGATIVTGMPSAGASQGTFGVDIKEVDALVLELHRVASVNPKAMIQHLNPEAVNTITLHNAHASEWR